MTEKQKRFCDEYLIDANVSGAARRSGYSESRVWQLLKKPEIRAYLDERLESIRSEKIATAEEVIMYLTNVLRGEALSSVVVVENIGEGLSEARELLKKPDQKEKLKAAELLGKRYGLYKENVDISSSIPIVIAGADLIE